MKVLVRDWVILKQCLEVSFQAVGNSGNIQSCVVEVAAACCSVEGLCEATQPAAQPPPSLWAHMTSHACQLLLRLTSWLVSLIPVNALLVFEAN